MSQRPDTDDDSRGPRDYASRPAPSVIFKTEPDVWQRTLLGIAVTLLSFISYVVWNFNRETGEMKTELRLYRESNDRRMDVSERRQAQLEETLQRLLLERR